MHRRAFILSSIAVTAAAGGVSACATMSAPAQPGFASDRIGVSVEGSGPDVILIPGLSSRPAIWDTTARSCVIQIRAVLYSAASFCTAARI